MAIAVALLAALVLPGTSRAQEPSQAALAFISDDGQVRSHCVAFVERDGSFTGADLLDRSGLEIILDASSGMGITVCQVESLGCPYPSKPCFCQCMSGSDCAYWNYYYRDPGQVEWIYSPLGAKLRQVQPGSIEVWVWGDGSSPPPGDLTFESVCESVPATPTLAPFTPTAAAPASIPVSATPFVPTFTPEPLVSTALPTSTHVPAPAASAGGPAAGVPSAWSAYLPFGLSLVALAAIGLYAWWRRSRGA